MEADPPTPPERLVHAILSGCDALLSSWCSACCPSDAPLVPRKLTKTAIVLMSGETLFFWQCWGASELADRQYDEVTHIAEKREKQLKNLYEATQQAELRLNTHKLPIDKRKKMSDISESLEQAQKDIVSSTMDKRVYTHMLERSKKEL